MQTLYTCIQTTTKNNNSKAREVMQTAKEKNSMLVLLWLVINDWLLVIHLVHTWIIQFNANAWLLKLSEKSTCK